jgi:hypothetical protein
MYSGTGTVKIADLGLATTLEQEAIEADLVQSGGRKVYGTPHFIAPEQARGEAVDNRSDLYSLGATAYRLLSGHTPFEGASTREILRALQSEEPRPLQELVADLPAELAAVITRLLQKDPGARFPTAEALRRECERLRLVAEHGAPQEATRTGGGRRAAAVLLLLAALGAGGWYFLRGAPAPSEGPTVRPLAEEADTGALETDPGFVTGTPTPAPAVDEEEVLRAREREAGQALREIAPFLAGEERVAALERIRTSYPGTAAAAAAAGEIAALRAQPGALGAASLDEALAELAEELAALARAKASLADRLRAIAGFRVAPELGSEFEARRTEHALAEVQAAEERARADFARAEALALDGKFAELRSFLGGLDHHFIGLADLPGDPARYAGLRALEEDLAKRRNRVEDEERFWHENAERKRRRAEGEALGPGSGLLAEIAALDIAALETRLAALPDELRARSSAAALAEELTLAQAALENLQREFEGGGWKRKSLGDPRSKKVREVRDVKPEGLVFDRDGALETVAWRETKSDPEWWHLLFQARLARDWTAEEARAIAAVLRLVGAARGAELAREMLAPGARGTLQPGELEALAKVFEPALQWIGSAPERAAIEHEDASAKRLARALGGAQERAWTSAAADLEHLLGEGRDSLLVRLLSDGADWREVERPAAAPTSPVEASDAPGGK